MEPNPPVAESSRAPAPTEEGGLVRVGEAFGPYRVTRLGPPSPVAARAFAVHERTQRSVLVHVRAVGRGGRRVRRELAAVEACARLHGAVGEAGRLLAIEAWGLWEPGRLAWVTAYAGSPSGVVTLEALAAAKGGRLPAGEARLAVSQLWTGVRAAQARGASQGPVDLAAVLVDPQGRVWLENYGLAAELAEAGSAVAASAEARKLELLSLGAALVRLTTGVAVPVPGWAGGALAATDGVAGVFGLPGEVRERLAGWTEEALAGVVTAGLRAEDGMPAVVEAVRGVLEGVGRAEAAAGSAVRGAAWEVAKGVLKGAAAVVRGVLGR